MSCHSQPTLTTVYNDKGYGNQAMWGFGLTAGADNFLQRAAANWTDKRMGLFLSRHVAEPGKDWYDGLLPRWKDSEIMTE